LLIDTASCGAGNFLKERKKMANNKFLDVDDESEVTGEIYKTHAKILNEIFEKKTKGGNPYKLALNSVYDIAANKKVWFPHIAETDNGGWKTPDHIEWINIPSPDRCTITQIPLENCKQNDGPADETEYAVFNCEKISEPYEYRFYGIFKRIKFNEKNHITIWKRISATLDIEEWLVRV
jgi:hypothetical protein